MNISQIYEKKSLHKLDQKNLNNGNIAQNDPINSDDLESNQEKQIENQKLPENKDIFKDRLLTEHHSSFVDKQPKPVGPLM